MSQLPLALIFGESENDTGAIKRLIPALLPEGRKLDSRPIRKPFTLARDASVKVRKEVAAAIRATEKGESRAGRHVLVIAHRDCDDHEPMHEVNGQELCSDLLNSGVKKPVAAIPAWDIESWWMLFPEALARTRSCWTVLNYGQRAVGAISRSKERLVRDLRSKSNPNCKDYRESDSLRIAEEITKMGPVSDDVLRRSGSLAKFRGDLIAALP